MNRKIMLLTGLAVGLTFAAPAYAWQSGAYYGGSGQTSSGGSTEVPEPGVLGLMGAGLIGLGLARRRGKTRD